jgi:hypothetical protein
MDTAEAATFECSVSSEKSHSGHRMEPATRTTRRAADEKYRRRKSVERSTSNVGASDNVDKLSASRVKRQIGDEWSRPQKVRGVRHDRGQDDKFGENLKILLKINFIFSISIFDDNLRFWIIIFDF